MRWGSSSRAAVYGFAAVDGATGGVGHLAVQLAATAGAEVYGHVRRAEQAAMIREWCGERVIVGVNRFIDLDEEATPHFTLDPELEKAQAARVKAFKCKQLCTGNAQPKLQECLGEFDDCLGVCIRAAGR